MRIKRELSEKATSMLIETSTSLNSALDLFESEICREISQARLLKILSIRQQLKLDCVYVSSPVLQNFDSRAHKKFDLSKPMKFPSFSMVIVNNNDIWKFGFEIYIETYFDNPESIFVIWDFDNHHWLPQSLQLCIFSDIYVPAHNEHLYYISRLNDFYLSPVQCPSVQWTREFLREKSDLLLTTPRVAGPLGIHKEYGRFKKRNQIVRLLEQNFPDVTLGGQSYETRGELERLTEWSSFKTHVIVPVKNDLPVRYFDALITGGIPVLPLSLESHVPQDLKEFTFFYKGNDLIQDMHRQIESAEHLFDKDRDHGIIERSQLTALNWHIDAAIEKIIGMSAKKVNCFL